MKVQALVGVALWMAGCAASPPRPLPAQGSTSLDDAEAAWAAGDLAAASATVEGWPPEMAQTARAQLLWARLELLRNRLPAAEAHAARARALGADEKAVASVLFDVYYRSGSFAQAAPLARAMGDAPRAAKLEAFGASTPYRVAAGSGPARVPFLETDPLPLVRARINGQEAHLLIDTGAGELIVSPEFARRTGVQTFGAETGTFAGGKHADVGEGRAETLELGGLRITDIPVNVLDTAPFAGLYENQTVDGVLGTNLLLQFQATLDYPGGALVLRPPGTTLGPASGVVLPFWWSGDHFLLTRGTLDRKASGLFFVDTGLAGAAFTCPASFLNEAGIRQGGATVEGMGGGGSVSATPFPIRELALGAATGHDLQGVSGVFPPQLERGRGFRIAGLVSHGFFRPYRLTFDVARMSLVLQPG